MAELIGVGAEARLYKKKDLLIKKRVRKNYRLKIIDETLRRERTRREARLLRKARNVGISVPMVVNVGKDEIIMEYVDGELLRDHLDNYGLKKREFVCRELGKIILKMHKNNIVHGDLTTSNMILRNDELFIIDFGLAGHSTRVEDKAVDLHLIKQALVAKHNQYWKKYWNFIIKEYKDKLVLARLEKVERRGRKKS